MHSGSPTCAKERSISNSDSDGKPISRPALDGRAFEALYRDQWVAVLNYVRFRLGPADAPDVAADVFARAWAHREALDPDTNDAKPWLWAIARNAATDWLRRQRASPGGLALPAPEGPDPQETVAHQMDLSQALAAMQVLSEQDREIIALRFGAGHTNRAIADALGLSESNVAVRLHRALLRVRKGMEREPRP